MKLRDKVLYMLLGALLVVLGMVLNHSINNADANTQAKNLNFLIKTLTDVEEANPGIMGKISTFDTILCKRIMCVNNEGGAVATMGFGASGGNLILNNNEGTETLHLSSGDKDVISYKKGGSDEKRFSLGLDENDNGVLSLHDKTGKNTSILGHDKNDHGSLRLGNKSGIRTATLGHDDTGNGGLWLHDKAGTDTSILGHDEYGHGGLTLYNKLGIRTSTLGHIKTGNGGLWLHDRVGTNTSILGHDVNDDGDLTLYSKSGILTSILGHDDTGNGGLWLHDKAGKNTSALGNDEYGHGSLTLYNKSGIMTSMLGHVKTGNGGLWLHDKVGRNTSVLGHDEKGNNYLKCENLVIQDRNARQRAFFGLSDNYDPMLKMYGDDGKHKVAYLGVNTENNEMMFELESKSKTDKGKIRMKIIQHGGLLGCFNNLGKPVAILTVADDGAGYMFTSDKYGYTK